MYNETQHKEQMTSMKKFHRRMLSIALIIGLAALTLIGFGINALLNLDKSSEECNCDPKFYDYIIDLKPDHINVYREDGREFVIEHDSLDEFVAKDNL